MKNRKLSARAVVSLMLSAILFCMPIGAFFANRTNKSKDEKYKTK